MHECVCECLKHIYNFSNLNFYASKHIIDVRNVTLVDIAKIQKSHFLASKLLDFALLEGKHFGLNFSLMSSTD